GRGSQAAAAEVPRYRAQARLAGFCDRGSCRDHKSYPVLILSNGHDFFERGWFGCWLTILSLGQALKKKSQGLGCHAHGFIQIASGGDDAGKVRKRNAVIAVRLLVDQGYVLSHWDAPASRIGSIFRI